MDYMPVMAAAPPKPPVVPVKKVDKPPHDREFSGTVSPRHSSHEKSFSPVAKRSKLMSPASRQENDYVH